VGSAGVDKGKGGKYLILPPGYKDKVPDGYIPMPSPTYTGFGEHSCGKQSCPHERVHRALPPFRAERAGQWAGKKTRKLTAHREKALKPRSKV